MTILKQALLTAVALLLASWPLRLEAATSGQWSYSGQTQWHPQDGRTGMAVTGTQCYFCRPDGPTVVATPAHTTAWIASAPANAKPPVKVEKEKCLNAPKGAPVDAQGCWVIKNLNFRFNSAKIESKYGGALKETAQVLKQNPHVAVEIQGHTDSTGPAAYNQKLSQRRANAVLHNLVEQGIEKRQLSARGYGEEKPIASNDNREGRAENRRVELKILP